MSSIEKKIWLWISLDNGLFQMGSDQDPRPESITEFDTLRLAIEKDGEIILSEYHKTDSNNGKEVK